MAERLAWWTDQLAAALDHYDDWEGFRPRRLPVVQIVADGRLRLEADNGDVLAVRIELVAGGSGLPTAAGGG